MAKRTVPLLQRIGVIHVEKFGCSAGSGQQVRPGSVVKSNLPQSPASQILLSTVACTKHTRRRKLASFFEFNLNISANTFAAQCIDDTLDLVFPPEYTGRHEVSK